MFHIAAMNFEKFATASENLRHWIAFFGMRRLLSGVVTAVACAVLLWLVFRPSPPPVESLLPVATFPSSSIATNPAEVTVHVAGAVVSPGVYRLQSQARVVDAVDAAGGALAKADLERINLAQIVNDTEQVYIPFREPARSKSTIAPRHRPTTTLSPTPAPQAEGAPVGGLVDLNTATPSQLDALPGVGPATAKAIIDYRTTKGRFTKIEDLLNVTGIGAAKFAALKDFITVSS